MRPDKVSNALADAIAALEKAEGRLKRAFTRWEKARQKVRRYDKALDRLTLPPR